MSKAKRAVKNAIKAGMIGATMWVVASLINVNAHNLTDGRYARWNIFAALQSEASDFRPDENEETVFVIQQRKEMRKKKRGEKMKLEIESYAIRQGKEAEALFAGETIR